MTDFQRSRHINSRRQRVFDKLSYDYFVFHALHEVF